VTEEFITYVDSSDAAWQDFRPGSRRTLYENPETGQLTMLVQWDAAYRTGAMEDHEYDEHLYIIAGINHSLRNVGAQHHQINPTTSLSCEVRI
jgi:hypothetical protein